MGVSFYLILYSLLSDLCDNRIGHLHLKSPFHMFFMIKGKYSIDSRHAFQLLTTVIKIRTAAETICPIL